jgi:hypothetical protein
MQFLAMTRFIFGERWGKMGIHITTQKYRFRAPKFLVRRAPSATLGKNAVDGIVQDVQPIDGIFS